MPMRKTSAVLKADAPEAWCPRPGGLAPLRARTALESGSASPASDDDPAGPGVQAPVRSRGDADRERRKLEIRAVMRILRGQITEPSPEERLWLAVIEFAVRDAFAAGDRNPQVRADARRWLDSDHFAGVAAAIGLNPKWARDKIHRIAEPR